MQKVASKKSGNVKNLKPGGVKGVRQGGRKPGVPNKATTEFRQTVRQLLEDNSANVGKWLTEVATGVPVVDDKGKPVPGKWIVPPDPDKALQRLTGLAEYAAPKLARTELVGDPDNPVQVSASSMTDEALIGLISKLGAKK
jgi:hypothetical protein